MNVGKTLGGWVNDSKHFTSIVHIQCIVDQGSIHVSMASRYMIMHLSHKFPTNADLLANENAGQQSSRR